MKTITAIFFALIYFFSQAQQIDDISPNYADAGETLDVTISGTNTFFTQATNTAIFFFFSGSSSTATTPNFFTINNDNQITANLTVPQNTYQGWYDYSVYTDIIGTLYQPESFQVYGEINNLNNEEKGSFKADLYPNPSNGKLTIKLEGSNQQIFNAYIIDTSGKQVKTATLKNGTNHFNLDKLEKGIYFVKIKESNSVRTFKIVKE